MVCKCEAVKQPLLLVGEENSLISTKAYCYHDRYSGLLHPVLVKGTRFRRNFLLLFSGKIMKHIWLVSVQTRATLRQFFSGHILNKLYLFVLMCDLIFFFFTNLMHKFFILIHLLYSSTCFEHYYAHLQENNCISTAPGFVTLETK